ncbi:MAG: VWA domain-containing protein [Salinirussus sp.]
MPTEDADPESGSGSTPTPAAASGPLGDRVRDELVRFVGALRAAGAEVPANASLEAARALGVVGFDDRDRARTAVQAAVLTRVEDVATFERLFERFWSRIQETLDPAQSRREEPTGNDVDGGLDPTTVEEPDESADGPERDDETVARDVETSLRAVTEDATGTDEEEVQTAEYSPSGSSEAVERGRVTGDDAATETAVGELTRTLAALAGRRSEPSRSGRRPDVRRAIRESVATGGVVTSVPETRPSPTEVRGALFVDVSRSVLDVVDRDFLIRFLRAVARSWRTARTFIFDTDVREVTDAFDADTTADAYAALADAEATWGGGTRIGHALTTVRRLHPEAVDRRTVAVVVSDGLEMGDVADLEAGMAWLARRASRVLWLNPLAKSEKYEPTAAGMAAALPHVDGLFAFTGPDDVAELARQLEQYRSAGALGYRGGREA